MKALRPLTASLMLLTSCLLISNTTLAKTTLKTES
ncbi:C4-dicarboxylate transport system binding protein [Escherichia coli]|uniref:C4-dicarboxylate transport system binding protein n=1 Tax=Escherichia coli TaxID=562 RepID=A0A484YR75_ECOLX|nr:C4-dicarboxylate transport system binding protein [Escherichia coli]